MELKEIAVKEWGNETGKGSKLIIKGDYQATYHSGWIKLISPEDTHLRLIPIERYGSWDICTLTLISY